MIRHGLYQDHITFLTLITIQDDYINRRISVQPQNQTSELLINHDNRYNPGTLLVFAEEAISVTTGMYKVALKLT